MVEVRKQGEKQAEVMQAMSQANIAQSSALQTWFEMFKQGADAQQHSMTVRSSDEYRDAQNRDRERLVALGYPIDKSPEEQLAWLIEQGDL